jgi:hypothetical protein
MKGMLWVILRRVTGGAEAISGLINFGLFDGGERRGYLVGEEIL